MFKLGAVTLAGLDAVVPLPEPLEAVLLVGTVAEVPALDVLAPEEAEPEESGSVSESDDNPPLEAALSDGTLEEPDEEGAVDAPPVMSCEHEAKQAASIATAKTRKIHRFILFLS